jgi:predicted ATPase/DNA-binding winged helix-turn-helix (wHTH) protein
MVEFGRFRLDAHRRELLADGLPVPIGSRAFDILVALVEAGGALVTKDELLHSVWSGTVVEEHNLQFQISTLRKALGPDRDFIKTISGRGYRFVADIIGPAAPEKATSGVGAASSARRPDRFPPTNLPGPTSELIGLDAAVRQVRDLLMERRAVTLIGPGGIGKTTLALEVARRVLPAFRGDVWLVELASLADPDLVPSTAASALGLKLVGGEIFPETVARAIGERILLLVLDNCEHVIDAAVSLAEAIVRLCPAASVLATSREVLRIAGECVYSVPPLEVPPPDQDGSDDVLGQSGVQLFVARAQALRLDFSPHDESLSAIAAICRRLDGIPLAIEFAAARAATLGVRQVASGLNDRFRLLTAGRRPALRRHQTLRATVDWSYELLPEPERRLLRHLAIFPGGVTFEAAAAIVSENDTAPAILDGIASLVAKSLVTLNVSATSTRWRLLETTRAYALEKLAESGERDVVARRHAEYYRDLFQRSAGESETRSAAEWLTAYGIDIDNVRAALDWAFSPGGDATIGVALTIAVEPLWLRLSLMDEWRRRVERALSNLRPDVSEGRRRDMQLRATLAAALFYTKGPSSEVSAAWSDVLASAEQLNDTEYRLRGLWGLWTYRLRNADYRAAVGLARRTADLPPNQASPTDRLVGERMLGASLFYMGDLTNARRHLEQMLSLSEAVTSPPHINIVRFHYDQMVAGRGTLAQILWLQGLPDQAMRVTENNVENARSIDHLTTLCVALDFACMVVLEAGDLATAERYVAMLLENSAKQLGFWLGWGHCYEGLLLIKRGDFANGLRHLQRGIDELRDAGVTVSYTLFLGAVARGLAGSGRLTEGLASVNAALAHASRNEELWYLPELLRIKGAIVVGDSVPGGTAMAEDLFLNSLDVARQQGALSLELRCATSVASVWHDQGRNSEARALLGPVYDRFTEGFETLDLQSAKAVLDLLRSHAD